MWHEEVGNRQEDQHDDGLSAELIKDEFKATQKHNKAPPPVSVRKKLAAAEGIDEKRIRKIREKAKEKQKHQSSHNLEALAAQSRIWLVLGCGF